MSCIKKTVLVVILLFVISLLMVLANPVTNVTIHCKENYILVEWKMPTDESRDIFISLLDPTCNSTAMRNNDTPRGSVTTDNSTNTTSATIYSDFNECGTTTTETTDVIVMKNTATLKITKILRSGITKRDYYYKYEIQCELYRNQTVSVGGGSYNMSDNIIIIKTYNASEKFTLTNSLDFYHTNNFTNKVSTSITVSSNDYIYVELQKYSGKFEFIVNQCFATPTKLYNGTFSDVFFDKKCSLDGTFSILSSPSDDQFRFQIQAFNFIQEKGSVYFHCRLYICEKNSGTSKCTQTCDDTGQRWRRDVGISTRFRRNAEQDGGPLQEILLTSKQITFNNKRTCEIVASSCPVNSKCYPLYPAVCVCEEGYVFSRITETCTKERIAVIRNVNLEIAWQPIYADNSSLEFRKLAVKYENLLYRLFIATYATREIEGIKIIKASQGSVVFEAEIKYAETTTEVDAYKSFVKSINSTDLKATNVRRTLKVLADRIPYLVSQITQENNQIEKASLAIIMVALAVVVLIIAIVIYKTMQVRSTKKTERVVFKQSVIKNLNTDSTCVSSVNNCE